jgi:integrase
MRTDRQSKERMIDSRTPPPINLKSIGAKLSRARYSRPEPFRSKAKPYKWLGEWHTYRRQTDGSEKRVHRGPIVLGPCASMTKTEAQAELDSRIARDRAPKDQKPAGEETLEWLIRQYLHLQKPHWEPETFRTTESIFKRHIGMHELAKAPLSKLTRAMLQERLNEMAAAGKSYSAIRKAKLLMCTVLTDAVEDGLLVKNPARKIKIPKVPKPCNRYLTEEECGRLLAAAPGRDRLIIRMCMVLGLRPGELFALRRDDIGPDYIRVDEASRNGVVKKPKTEASEGKVSLPSGLAKELHWWLDNSPEDPTGLLFPSNRAGKPIRQNNYLKRTLSKIAEAANVEGVTFQSLRRTTATHAQHLGTVKDVQGMLRHASPDVTAGVYMQTVPESQKRATEALDVKLGRVQ